MLQEFAWDPCYRVLDSEKVLTPALVMYPDIVAANIERTIALLGGNARRWRVHIKTAKMAYTLRMLAKRGVRNFKCATTLELLTACQNGAEDVLFAYPVIGANAHRVAQIAGEFPEIRISVLAEREEQLRQWQGSRVGVFLDINPGMNRTGIDQTSKSEVIELVRTLEHLGIAFRGLHYYDGQYGSLEESERQQQAHKGYDKLLELVNELTRQKINVPEVITAGTPTFPASLSYRGFQAGGFVHAVSPGTLVYNDATSLKQLPGEYGYRPAVLVSTRVVSQPAARIVTCDAGHKAVSADAGVPTCLVIGHPELMPLSPSEEHLPMESREGADTVRVGEMVYLLPRHICPTVNNFDRVLLIRNGQIEAVEQVSARGHEGPLDLSKQNSGMQLLPTMSDAQG